MLFRSEEPSAIVQQSLQSEYTTAGIANSPPAENILTPDIKEPMITETQLITTDDAVEETCEQTQDNTGRPIHYLDSEQLDAYLREFDHQPSSYTIDYAARWREVSRALAYDLAALGDEQGRNHRLGADISNFGRDIAGTLGSTHAFGMDTTLASGNCGTDLKGFKGLNEGMKRM